MDEFPDEDTLKLSYKNGFLHAQIDGGVARPAHESAPDYLFYIRQQQFGHQIAEDNQKSCQCRGLHVEVRKFQEKYVKL